MVSPPAKREAVRVAREEGRLSERRACGLLRMHRGSCRYRRRERNDAALRARLREIAAERPRFGYRRLHRLLRREQENGVWRWVVNHKRVYRIYQEEGLAMRRRKRKRFRAEARVPLVLPTRANQVWTMDFRGIRLASGRKFRTLNLMDGFTRQAHGSKWTLRCRGCAWCGCWTKSSKSGECQKRFRWTMGRSSSVGRWTSGPSRTAWRALHRTGQAGAECLHRKFQREVPGRMSEPELVREPERCAADHRSLAEGLQSGAAAQRSGVSDAGGVRGPRSQGGVCIHHRQRS